MFDTNLSPSSSGLCDGSFIVCFSSTHIIFPSHFSTDLNIGLLLQFNSVSSHSLICLSSIFYPHSVNCHSRTFPPFFPFSLPSLSPQNSCVELSSFFAKITFFLCHFCHILFILFFLSFSFSCPQNPKTISSKKL